LLTELVGRGLRPPLLSISDGAPGLIGACEQVFGRSLRQRCLIHRARNLLAKVPAEAQTEIKNAYWKLFDLDGDKVDDDEHASKIVPGPELVAYVQARIEVFAKTYGPRYPAAVKCLLTDREQLTSYLRFPVEHHRRIRHSNFIERTFGETRRRVKVIGRLPGELSCLSLVWAVLDRASRGWRGFTMTSEGTRALQDLRRALLDPPNSDPASPPKPARTSTPKLSEPSPNIPIRAEPTPEDLHRTWDATCHAAWFRCRRGGEAVVSGEQTCARALTAEPS